MVYAIYKVWRYNTPHVLKKNTATLCSIKTALLHHLYIEITNSFFWAKYKQSFSYFVTYTLTLYVVLRELPGDKSVSIINARNIFSANITKEGSVMFSSTMSRACLLQTGRRYRCFLKMDTYPIVITPPPQQCLALRLSFNLI